MLARLFSHYFYGGIIYLLATVLISLSSLIRAPLIINKIDISTYGVYVLIISSVPIAISLLSFGSGFLSRRYLPNCDNRKQKEDLFIPQFYFRLSIILLVCIISLIFSELIEFSVIPNKFYLRVTVLFFLLYYFFEQIADYFRYTHRIKLSSLMGLAYNYIIITLIYIFSFLDLIKTNNSLIVIHIISLLVILLPAYAKGLSEIKFSPKRYNGSGELKKDIKIGFPLILNNLNESVINIGDRYILGFLISTAAVGFYTPAYAIGSLLLILARVSTGVLPPIISKLFDEQKKDTIATILTLFTKFYLTISLGFFAGCLFYGFDFLEIYINRQFANNATTVLAIISFSSVFSGMNYIFSNIFYVELKTKFMLIVNLSGTVFNVIANIILILIFDNIMVAAITTLLTFLIVFTIYFLNVKSYLYLRFSTISILKILIPSLVIIITALSMQNNWLFIQNFYIKVIVSSLLFIFTVVVLEKQTILGLYKIIRNR